MTELNTYPKTYEEWWASAEAHWSDLLNIMQRFIHPDVLKEKDPIKMLAEKNPDLARLMNDAWFNAPDDRRIHMIPSWNVLCNLCSEAYLLHDEEEEMETVSPPPENQE